jgi:type I restriction enzyme R subunit
MEHAIRSHIREHLDEDPVLYRKLLARAAERHPARLVDEIRAGHVADDRRGRNWWT